MNKISLIILLFAPFFANAQVTLNELIIFGLNESNQSKDIDFKRQILDFQTASYQSSLGWKLSLDGQVPAYAKSNLSTVQNDGNIAFQSVDYNNSSLGLNLSKTIWRTGGEVQVTSGLQRFDNFQAKSHIYNGIPIRLTFQQNLLAYNPYKWEQKNNQLKKDINQRQSNVDKMEIKLNITNSFFAVLSAQNEILSNKDNVKLTQNLMSIAKAQDSLGLISRKQLLQLKLQLKTAQSYLNIAQINFKTAKKNLENLLSNKKSLGDDFEIPVPRDISIDLDSILNLAKANRPEWIEQLRQIKEKEQNIKAQMRQYGPYIGMDASIGMIRSDAELPPIYNNAQQDQSISISFNLPIFDSRLKRNKVQLAKVELAHQKNEREQAILNLENDLSKLVLEFQATQIRLAYAEEIKNIATENLQITTETFKLGLINIAELNLAIQEKNQAYRNYISEIRRYWLFFHELMLERTTH